MNSNGFIIVRKTHTQTMLLGAGVEGDSSSSYSILKNVYTMNIFIGCEGGVVSMLDFLFDDRKIRGLVARG